jgi:hypothetical protein
MLTPINLIKGDKVATNTDYRDAIPVNMTAVAKPILGAAGYMLQEPGLTQFGTAFAYDRGANYNERFEMHFRTSGGRFCSISAGGVPTILGTIDGSNQCSLPYSFNTQGLVSNGRFFLYSPTGGFSEITDPDLGSPIDCVWIDGYYFFTDGEYLFHTDINNETAIDPLKFATSEFSPDPTWGVGKTSDNKVIVFNRFTTEYFVNAAQENFAFQRVATRAIKIGIIGTHCKTEVADTWFIMGGRKEESISVHQLGVGSANKIATREVDKIIGLYSEEDLRSTVLESYSEDGYDYMLVHLPNHVLKFNYTLAKSQGIDFAWSILKTDVLGDAPWRAKNGIFEPRVGYWVFGDKIDSRLGKLDSDTALQYGEIVEWLLFTPFMYLEDNSIDQFSIQTIPGFTATNDATVFLSLTYNGITYGHEVTINYGAPANYGQRFEINRLGYVDNWFAFKLRGATRSRMAFATAWIDHG